jgi:ABC-type sugar transport system permease subunit
MSILSKTNDNSIVTINDLRDDIDKPDKLKKKLLAKYTNNDRDIRKLRDDEFMDYAAFLVQQRDVHSTEKARDAYDTTKNFKKIKTFKDALKVISVVLVVMLVIAIILLLVFAIIYLFVYMKKDKVKMVIDFYMLGVALSFVAIFLVFLYLFLKMSGTIKKIISLL